MKIYSLDDVFRDLFWLPPISDSSPLRKKITIEIQSMVGHVRANQTATLNREMEWRRKNGVMV